MSYDLTTGSIMGKLLKFAQILLKNEKIGLRIANEMRICYNNDVCYKRRCARIGYGAYII